MLPVGADVNAKDKHGNTPLYEAMTRSYPCANIWAANLLLSHGADINVKNNDGETVLKTAVFWCDNVEVIKYLVSHGADIHAKNNNGTSSLDWAKEMKTANGEYICRVAVEHENPDAFPGKEKDISDDSWEVIFNAIAAQAMSSFVRSRYSRWERFGTYTVSLCLCI